MKRPLISYTNRLIARKVPDSIIASKVKSTIAMAKLKREIGKSFEPIVKRIEKWITQKNSD